MSVSPVCSCLSCPTHTGSVARPVTCGFYPSSSMTDAQWELLEPLLPPPGNTGGRGGRPEKHDRRRVLDAIFYVVRGGIAWAALRRSSRRPRRSMDCSAAGSGPGCGSGCTTPYATEPGSPPDARRCPPRRDRLRLGARRGHRTHGQPRLRRRQAGQRPQAPPGGGHHRAAAGRGRHRRWHPGPRRCLPPPGRAAGQVLHHHPDLGSTAATPDDWSPGPRRCWPSPSRSSSAPTT